MASAIGLAAQAPAIARGDTRGLIQRTDLAQFLPRAALERSPPHIEREMKTLDRSLHDADHLGQVIVDDGFVRDEGARSNLASDHSPFAEIDV